MVVVLGGGLMLGVPTQLRQARLLTALRGIHHEGLDARGEWLRALTQLLSAPRYASQPYTQRLTIARSISGSSLAPPPSVATVVAGLLLYGLSLAMPVWVFAQHGVDIFATVAAHFAGHEVEASRRDFDKEIAAASGTKQRVKLLLGAADQAEDEEDYERAHDYYLRAAQAAQGLPTMPAMRVKAVLGVARNAQNRGAASAMLKDLESTLTSADRTTRLQRADVQVVLSQEFSTTTRAITLSRMTEVVATREALLAPADHELIEARQVLAWYLWQAGRGAEAELQLRSRVRALLSTTCDVQCAANGDWLRTQVYLDLGWLLLGMEKHESAAQLVSHYAAQLPQAGNQLRSGGKDVAALPAWIRAAAGDYAAASATLAASVEHDRASSSLFNEL